MTSSLPARPFDDAYLLAYSREHVAYEFDMFLWLSFVCGSRTALQAPTPEDAQRLSNVLVEAFVIHLRNVIEFLYSDNPQPTDVVASDFLIPGTWMGLRPAMSPQLGRARTRANKEVAHLTTDRITGSPPTKAWDFSGLLAQLRPLIRLFVEKAEQARLAPEVRGVI